MIEESVRKAVEQTVEEEQRKARERRERELILAACQGNGAIEGHIRSLDREWDIERMLEANASFFSILGVALALMTSKKWLALPAIVSGFLMQQVWQGSSPPVELLRRMGMRTRSEIQQERCALKALRGDFDDLPKIGDETAEKVRRLLERVEK